jgi:hypothetical protein
MAPVYKERVDHILENYFLALACVDQCPTSAQDAVKSRLAANLERAERAYADAAADGLLDVSAAIEADLQALGQANEQARARLHGGTPITDLLAGLEHNTEHADRILRIALSRPDSHDQGHR